MRENRAVRSGATRNGTPRFSDQRTMKGEVPTSDSSTTALRAAFTPIAPVCLDLAVPLQMRNSCVLHRWSSACVADEKLERDGVQHVGRMHRQHEYVDGSTREIIGPCATSGLRDAEEFASTRSENTSLLVYRRGNSRLSFWAMAA